MAKPLAGIKVIELANFIAGPLCGTLLADMGADVIKVEPPKGDMARATPPIRNGESVSFVALNRNKRSLVLDLKRPEASGDSAQAGGAVGRLCRSLSSGRAGEARARRRAGESGQSAHRLHIRFRLRSKRTLSPSRRRQPDHRGVLRHAVGDRRAGKDADAAGRADGGRVRRAVRHLRDTLAGLVGAGRTGEGFVADVSLVETAIAAAAWEAADYLETGKVPQPLGNRHRLNAPYQLFECKDGRYLAIGTPNDQLFKNLMTVLGLEAHIGDPRFVSYASRKANEDALLAVVEPAVCAWNSQEIEAALMTAGVPCACVNNFKQVFDDPHIDRARRRERCRTSPPRPYARGAQSDFARPRWPRHRSQRTDVGRTFRRNPAPARLFGRRDCGIHRRRRDPQCAAESGGASRRIASVTARVWRRRTARCPLRTIRSPSPAPTRRAGRR